MKKIYSLLTILVLFTSCADMLEPNSDRQALEPELNDKTDSVFYAMGIAQAMQQVADQYFYQGEMRGDLIATTTFTDNNLRKLADFSADITNRYDSAYAYYKIINNCNYYIAHRKSDLYTGATNITVRELSAVQAFRAWAYLQLARNYGSVPFFTEPLTSISQIDDNTFPMYGINEITAALAPQLEQYRDVSVPDYSTRPVGTPNWSTEVKNVATEKCFIPAAVILGDLYLESGQYEKAAETYYQYLSRTHQYCALAVYTPEVNSMGNIPMLKSRSAEVEYPANYAGLGTAITPQNFYINNTDEIISYIPMAVSRVNGKTTNVPYSFGFDYYALSNSETWQDDIQLVASEYYNKLTASQTFYYINNRGISGQGVSSLPLGDQRATEFFRTRTESATLEEEASEKEWIDKFRGGNIILYRVSTVFLHLAEAYNRMGMPDLAFAILKEGICEALVADENEWMTPESKAYLNRTFLNDVNKAYFQNANSYGIHSRGCGVTYDRTFYGRKEYTTDSYQYATVVGAKLKEMAENTSFYPDLMGRIIISEQRQELYLQDLAVEKQQRAAYDEAKRQYDEAHADDPNADPYPEYETTFDPEDPKYASLVTKADTMMAVEELLCDEEAMEFCFEGTRWYDLMRFARHKNRAGLQGNQWLAERLKAKNPTKNLATESNWFLPFK